MEVSRTKRTMLQCDSGVSLASPLEKGVSGCRFQPRTPSRCTALRRWHAYCINILLYRHLAVTVSWQTDTSFSPSDTCRSSNACRSTTRETNLDAAQLSESLIQTNVLQHSRFWSQFLGIHVKQKKHLNIWRLLMLISSLSSSEPRSTERKIKDNRNVLGDSKDNASCREWACYLFLHLTGWNLSVKIW